ncbi:MAG: hypothetical protein OEZ01_14515, partial [Candidatus Heimdallarchaeota archaeon]|nr:hypothetical protein [Candidatus Heimdallarchaeota archaeon]
MIDFRDLIRIWVKKQVYDIKPNLYLDKKIELVVDKGIMIYGNFGIQARTGLSSKNTVRRQLKNCIQMPWNNVNRYFSYENLSLLKELYKKQSENQDLLNFMQDVNGKSISSIESFLDLPPLEVKNLLKTEQKNWQIYSKNDIVWNIDTYTQQYHSEKNIGNEIIEKIILKLLNSYPLIKLDQLKYFVDLDDYTLNKTIKRLSDKNLIKKRITRQENIDELICLKDEKLDISDIDWDEAPKFILEKRDFMVELLKLNVEFKDIPGNYWFFMKGVPQITFNLKSIPKMYKYQIYGIYRLATITEDLNQILDELNSLFEFYKIKVDNNYKDQTITNRVIKSLKFLLKRGYQLENKELIRYLNQGMDVNQSEKPSEDRGNKLSINLNQLYSKIIEKQINMNLSPLELLSLMGPFESIESICIRTNTAPNDLNLEDIAFISGIDSRNQFVPIDLIPVVLSGWPRTGNLSLIDNQIIKSIGNGLTLDELVKKSKLHANKIKQRLLYLEKIRILKRRISIDLNIDKCIWEPFHKGLDLPNHTIESKSMVSIGKILHLLLGFNFPLTKSQCIKYLGITASEFERIVSNLMKKNLITEGYFLEIKEPQYIATSLLDNQTSEVIDEEENYLSDTIQLFPMQDPITQFNLP